MEIKKDMKKPIKSDKHVWERNDDGSVNEFALSQNFCNGPICLICGSGFCMHCTPSYDDIECIGHYECGNCGYVVKENDKYCSECGTGIDWGDE